MITRFKLKPKELPAPPTGPVRWRIRPAMGPGADEYVVARTACEAWKLSKFYLAGYAFSAVRCFQDPE